MNRTIFIITALALTFGVIAAWSFELPRIQETIGAADLLLKSALIGSGIGIVIGIWLATKAQTFIGIFQVIASSLLICTLTSTLVGHYTNRAWSSNDVTIVELPVKQVTARWSGRGLSKDQLREPDGYQIIIETDQGQVGLYKPGADAPDIGPSRTFPVKQMAGYWGYPRYAIQMDDQPFED